MMTFLSRWIVTWKPRYISYKYTCGDAVRKNGSEANRFVLVVYDNTIDLHATKDGVEDDGKKLMVVNDGSDDGSDRFDDGLSGNCKFSSQSWSRLRHSPRVKITFPRENDWLVMFIAWRHLPTICRALYFVAPCASFCPKSCSARSLSAVSPRVFADPRPVLSRVLMPSRSTVPLTFYHDRFNCETLPDSLFPIFRTYDLPVLQ